MRISAGSGSLKTGTVSVGSSQLLGLAAVRVTDSVSGSRIYCVLGGGAVSWIVYVPSTSPESLNIPPVGSVSSAPLSTTDTPLGKLGPVTWKVAPARRLFPPSCLIQHNSGV